MSKNIIRMPKNVKRISSEYQASTKKQNEIFTVLRCQIYLPMLRI